MSSHVNVHERTIHARHRLRPANGKQDSLHITEFEREQLPWWNLDRWINWEHLTVAGREVKKGFVVSPFVAGLITVAFGIALTSSVGLYWRLSDSIEQRNKEHIEALQSQRDMLIEMKTRLEERTNAAKEAESKRDREQHDAEETAKVFREKMNERMSIIERKASPNE